jgi:hypothetical protein
VTIASWEFWAFANMLMAAHEAEEEVPRRLQAAEKPDDCGEKVALSELGRPAEIRAERAKLEG